MIRNVVAVFLLSSPLYAVSHKTLHKDRDFSEFVKHRISELEAHRAEQLQTGFFGKAYSWFFKQEETSYKLSKLEEAHARKLFTKAGEKMMEQLEQANPGADWKKLTTQLETEWEKVKEAEDLQSALTTEVENRREVETTSGPQTRRIRRDFDSGPYLITDSGNPVQKGPNSYDLCQNEAIFGSCSPYQATLNGTAAFYFARVKAFAADVSSPFLVECLTTEKLASFIASQLPAAETGACATTWRFCPFQSDPISYDKHGNPTYPPIRGTALFPLPTIQMDVSCADFESGYNGIIQACQHQAQANVKTAIIVGSVIGGVVGLVVIGGVVYCICTKYHRNARKEAPARRAEARLEIKGPTEVVIDRARAVDNTEV